jgi:hypothetical protein
MTRFTQLASLLAVTGALAGSAVVACGGHPGSPGEMPPAAPRPALTPGPVSLTIVPVPELAAARYGAAIDPPTAGPPGDAGVPPADSYTPPLPPLPDGGVPTDSRLEPRNGT